MNQISKAERENKLNLKKQNKKIDSSKLIL